jgi:hypothetical protein
MSYNQTNNIHNPFEGEELEKGRFNLGRVEKDISEAISAIFASAKKLRDTHEDLKEAARDVYSSSQMMAALEIGIKVDPKRFDKGDARKIRSLSSRLKKMSDQLKKEADLIPKLESAKYNVELAVIANDIKEFNKRRR